jgi:hypothetical protein
MILARVCSAVVGECKVLLHALGLRGSSSSVSCRSWLLPLHVVALPANGRHCHAETLLQVRLENSSLTKRDVAHRCVDAVHVHLGHKFDARRLVRVPVTTVDGDIVDAAVVRRVARPDDGACPRVHVHVVGVGHAVANGAVADPLFSFLQLLQQAEASGNHCRPALHMSGCTPAIFGRNHESLQNIAWWGDLASRAAVQQTDMQE